MNHWIVSALLLVGGGLLFLAALGVLRMPDIFTRMQAATKAGTLGVGLVLAAAAVTFGRPEVTITALVTIGFFLLTAPVAAHMIGRAAYLAGVPLWDRNVRDEWNDNNRSTSERR